MGVDKHNRPIIVPDKTICNVMSTVYANYRPETGDVDLMIRTGGDQRISNFLLWQMAYAELYFTPTKWPDFSVSEMNKIIQNVSGRERRYGNVTAQKGLVDSIESAEVNKASYLKGINS